ncbi:CD97 antigen-like, partial [Clarias magur]
NGVLYNTFQLLNSQQGTFIFLVHCLLNHEAPNNPSINMTRDLMMCCLMEYIGELDQLIKEYE